MTDGQLVDALTAVLREQLRQPGLQFDPAARLGAVPGYDSVVAIQLVLGLERAFDLMLDEDEIERMNTMDDVRAILRARVPVDA